MGWNRKLRDRARVAFDGLFCSASPHVQRIGDEGSGWVIDTRYKLEVCYCAGVGKGITFEEGIAKLAAKPVVVLDPSPTATPTIARTKLSNTEFLPIGLAAEDGVVEFSVPKDPDEGSYSVARDGLERVRFRCEKLPTIMAAHGHRAIDLLKMDIEGFEYGVVEQILAERIAVRQLCVEFHPWLRPRQTWKTIWQLYRSGYRLIFKHRGDHTFVMNDERYAALLRSSGDVARDSRAGHQTAM